MADTQKKIKVVLIKYTSQSIKRSSTNRYLKSLGVRVHSINCQTKGDTFTIEIWEQVITKTLRESQKTTFYKDASKVFMLYPKYSHESIFQKNKNDAIDAKFYVGAENVIIIPDISSGYSRFQGGGGETVSCLKECLINQIVKDTIYSTTSCFGTTVTVTI